MTNDQNRTNLDQTKKPLNLWAVYGICLLVASIFFFLFGFNSPLHTFNSDCDYQWYLTIGHGLISGKIPYRDLFEQKGPLVYFLAAFCCLFKNPDIIMLMIEIICMSLFFFFTYRIAIKRLNSFSALITIPILALTIFTSWCPMNRACIVEEFSLSIYAYFLLCWLDFILEKHQWTWTRSLCLGLCFGILICAKYTLLYFMVAPLIIWLLVSIKAKDWRRIVRNVFSIALGIIIIILPMALFYIFNHALNDLIKIYFIINITTYANSSLILILRSLKGFFLIGPWITFLMVFGVLRFTFKHWIKDKQ